MSYLIKFFTIDGHSRNPSLTVQLFLIKYNPGMIPSIMFIQSWLMMCYLPSTNERSAIHPLPLIQRSRRSAWKKMSTVNMCHISSLVLLGTPNNHANVMNRPQHAPNDFAVNPSPVDGRTESNPNGKAFLEAVDCSEVRRNREERWQQEDLGIRQRSK